MFFLLEILIVLITSILLVTFYFYTSYQYWSTKDVPVIPPRFPLGHRKSLLPGTSVIGTISRTFYDHFKKQGVPLGGVYMITTPVLVLISPEYIKDILTHDFNHFTDHYTNETIDILDYHLFALQGKRWREMRTKLTATFTSAKIKKMFNTMVECGENMKEELEKRIKQDPHTDIRYFFKGYSIDVIGSCAFGLSCNSFKNPNSEFRIFSAKFFTLDHWAPIKRFIIQHLPTLSSKIGLHSNRQEVVEFFTKLVEDTVNARKESNIEYTDFLQILIDLNKNQEVITLEEMVAQVFVFFIAGFDTSASTMTDALFELAKNQESQDKLRKELEQISEKYNGELTYESVSEMKYLGQVLDETLRLYPPSATITRRCTKDYKLRDTEIIIEKGTPVLVSLLDPEHFPDPEQFDPERFSKENIHNIRPFKYFPFGEGPRNCIGARFGILQTKIGIFTIIKNFQLTTSSRCAPVEFEPDTFFLGTINKIYIQAKKYKYILLQFIYKVKKLINSG